jgi:3-phosphoshikimate 1-carboxyvinyltransferase
MSDVRIDPVGKPFAATITPPGSKSLTNRALVLAALADGTCDVSNVLFADDTDVMLESLARLSFRLTIDRDAGTVHVHGRGGRIDSDAAELFCANSGTTIRFLTALCALGHGRFTLDGVARMRQRPIGALTGLLKTLGARVSHPGADGFPPVRIDADGLAGGIVRYGKEASSQYLSAILMIAPYAQSALRIELAPKQTSWPYVAMTMQLMERFGVTPQVTRDSVSGEPKQIVVARGAYAPTRYVVEPDASNASYFLAAAAVNPGSKVTIEGLDRSSLQGDVGFADVLHRMGADLVFGQSCITLGGPASLHPVDVDLSGMPDMAQTLGVVALFATGRSALRGLRTLRVKETDRIAALATELKKLGASIYVDGDAMSITPPTRGNLASASIATYDDHRMAMSFAVAGTRVRGITIRDVECVSKTYPRYFHDLKTVTTTG